jgi:phosphopantetheinyl transferase
MMTASTIVDSSKSRCELDRVRRIANWPAREVWHRYLPARELDAAARLLAESSLSLRERKELAAWKDADRRRAWLLGRMLAKRLIAERLGDGLRPAAIEILSRDAAGRVNRPRVWRDGCEQSWPLSISHSQRGALAAFSTADGVALGVDLAAPARLSAGFVRLWFTTREQDWLRGSDDPGTGCLVWAAKEALYKACNAGEGFGPTVVELFSNGQCRYRDRHFARDVLQSWTIDGQHAVMAVITNVPATHSLLMHRQAGNKS